MVTGPSSDLRLFLSSLVVRRLKLPGAGANVTVSPSTMIGGVVEPAPEPAVPPPLDVPIGAAWPAGPDPPISAVQAVSMTGASRMAN